MNCAIQLIIFSALEIPNVGGGNAAANETHSNQAIKQITSTKHNIQSNNQASVINKTYNHISMNHNHTNVNTSLGHKSPSFIVKPSILPFLNR